MNPKQEPGWIEWNGGVKRPISAETVVQVKLREGDSITAKAKRLRWWTCKSECDIIAYRVAEGGAK